MYISKVYRAVSRDFLWTPIFEMVIFPYQHHDCLGVKELQVSDTSDLLNLLCGVKYVTLVPSKTQ